MGPMEGVFLPLVTPFHDGDVDIESLQKLVKHYISTGVSGLIMLGTTGESPTVEPDEQRMIIETALEAAGGVLPVYVGVSGNATRHVIRSIAAFAPLGVAGYLVATPYYNRPSAGGMIAHYQALAEETDRTIIVYNVPYRTGVNLPNDALFEIVATTSNVRAVKDSTGNIAQSLDLLERAPRCQCSPARTRSTSPVWPTVRPAASWPLPTWPPRPLLPSPEPWPCRSWCERGRRGTASAP